jgi:NAD(P)-dependent dehydrogenase (short-subunit alcohol dehydrogenase family)
MERLQAALADHPQIHLFVCDVADESVVDSFVQFVRERASRADVLINCAGGFGAIGPIDQVDSAGWMQTIQSNLFGSFLTIKHFLPLLEMSQTPQILNFSGGGAFSPFPNFSAYACAKAAIVRLTETLAVELAPRGISVNAIAPGVIPTKAHEATIMAGEELAGSVQFHRTRHLLQNGTSEINKGRMETIRQCVRALISEPFYGLTGKTISANFDHWSSEAFRSHIADITRSELFTMRRMNLVNLPDGLLRSSLMKTWAKHSTRR